MPDKRADSQMRLPANLAKPSRLRDPLRVFRVLLGYLLLQNLIVGLVPIVLNQVFLVPIPDSIGASAIGAFVSCPMLFLVWRILPSRRTNAFYFRSFRKDDETAIIRQEIQKAIGSRFRLSGIRAPSRRWPVFLQYLGSAFFFFRYATTRYMNLEAGDDWLARIWRSLADARCVFLDATDITPAVHREFQLMAEAAGADRILFLVDRSRPVEEWKRSVVEELGLSATFMSGMRFAVWPGNGATREQFGTFRAEVQRFAAGLPKGTLGLRWSAYPLVVDQIPTRQQHRLDVLKFTAGVIGGFALGVVILSFFHLLVSRASDPHASYPAFLAVVACFGGIYLYLAYSIVRYLMECGSLKQTVATAAWSATVTGFYVICLLALNSARLSADRTIGSNNLRIIGLAMLSYESSEGAFPPQFLTGADGRPMHSWRILVLKYLGNEYSALYNSYNFAEPWDGPNNHRLAEQIPDVYRSSHGFSSGGVTDYFVIADPRAVFRGSIPTRIANITDGLSQTIVAVELNKSGINWLEPRDLSVDDVLTVLESQKKARLKAPFSDGINALFCDGTIEFLRIGFPSEAFRDLVTKDGGEIVSKDR
jgi:hypothetical protein